jgi:hypothetical protein
MLIKFLEVYSKEDSYALHYKGVVVDNTDPDKLGRIKCTIKGRWEEGDFSKLPWVFPLSPCGLGGRVDLSSFCVPEVDSEVVIEFPFGDEYSPFYVGYWVSNATTKGTLFEENYPDTYGWVDSTVQWVRVNKQKKYLEYYNSLKNLIRVTEKGDIHINSAGNVVINAGKTLYFNASDSLILKSSDTSIEASGGIFHKAGGNFSVDGGGDVDLKAGGQSGVASTGKVVIAGSGVDLNSGPPLGTVDSDSGSHSIRISDLDSKIEELKNKVTELQALHDKLKGEVDSAKSTIKG